MIHDPSEPVRTYDVLVVGAGGAGAVMASRLSEDPRRSVLLLEAGPDEPADEALRRAVRDAGRQAVAEGLNWKLRSFVKDERAPLNCWDYEAGKLVGGCTAVNTVQALRGMPADYDDWALTCGDSWSWESVLPFFRRLENDPAGADRWHGRDGPTPIRRETADQLRVLPRAFREACLARGFAEVDDHNDPGASGVGVIPKNVLDGIRMSTALTYLRAARARPNLSVVTGVLVDRLTWHHDASCSGVEAVVDGHRRHFTADRVILCGGAVNTPAILLRSGVGDPARLAPLGIAVRQPLCGVGRGLMDHPAVGIWGVPAEHAWEKGEPLRQVLLRTTSAGSAHANDLHVSMVTGFDVAVTSRGGDAMVGLSAAAGPSICAVKSFSRGAVDLVSDRCTQAPRIALNLLADPRDLPPLREGVRLAWQLLQHPALKPLFERQLGWSQALVDSDAVLDAALNAYVRPAAHLGGSARMGRDPQEGAVVDHQGRVHGTTNLWIADASVMPSIPSAPPMLTTLMVAEKLAAGFKESQS